VDTIKIVLEQFTNETVNISLSVLLLMTFIMIAYWYYNRRKFHQLRHQIPASVVNNYLDSIIANSNALKSSLFRGGGLEIGEGVPSIMPTSELPLGGVSATGDESEELAQKNAEISNLKSMLHQKDVTIAELEKKLKENSGDGGEEVGILRSEVDTLKGQLEEANRLLEEAKNSADEGVYEELSKERDELKERLMEYEIIEEDLANLKRYQQENEELNKTIEALRNNQSSNEASPSEDNLEEVIDDKSEAIEEEPEEKVVPLSEVDTAQAEAEQKSAEELLSEFEKMLG